MSENVIVKTTADAAQEIKNSPDKISAAIVPYFPFGDSDLWRKHLSTVGTTFDCDVGFGGRRDAVYARRVITKNLELHEHENLARLFQLWPLSPVSDPVPAWPDSSSLNWLSEIKSSMGLKNGYVVVQFGAGYPSKEWPPDCWIPFLREFLKATEQPIIITGGTEWRDSADTALREINIPGRICNFAGATDVNQLMALIHGASFLIGGCSGPKHIAMMYKVPTFTLYSATEPQRWGATEDHHLHAYVNALPQKLTGLELQGLNDDFRPRLLDPAAVATAALHHYRIVMRPVKPGSSSDLPFA
jgi:ADP-heptose:LPS heptosyltransferase